MPVYIPVLILLLGITFAYQDTTTSNSLLMLLGLLMVPGTLVLAGGCYIKVGP